MCAPFLRRRPGWSGVPGTAACGRAWLWMAGWMMAAILPAGFAEASCGDWLEGHVLTRGHVVAEGPAGRALTADTSPLGDLADPAAGRTRPIAAPRPSLPEPPPCDGPACRRAPLLPTSPPAPVAEPIPLDSALLEAAPRTDPAACSSNGAASDPRPIRVVGCVPTPPPRPVPTHV
jgi:hypothetical protein